MRVSVWCCHICAAAGIRALDGMIVSHLDQDHSGGAASVLRGIQVRRVISSIMSGHQYWAASRPSAVWPGMQWSSGDLQWSILHPSASDYERRLTTNAMSCIALVQQRCNARVLLTGDLPGREEQRLVVREADLHATLLMVPHHGSRSSSSAALLARWSPLPPSRRRVTATASDTRMPKCWRVTRSEASH